MASSLGYVISKGRTLLNSSATRGIMWTVGGFGSSQVLRFIGNLILTRLLMPQYFGLMTFVNGFCIGLIWLADFGIGKSIVQSQRWNDQTFLNTAWTIQVLQGIGTWLLILAISVPLSQYYGDPILATLLPVVGFTAIFLGLNSTKRFTLNRKMELGKITTLELGSSFAGILFMIIWAAISPTVWALAFGTLLQSGLKMLGSHFLLPGQINRLGWDRSAWTEIFTFGRWAWLETTMMFLAEQADRLILGKLFTFALLGVYSIAFALADLPRQVVKKVSLQVIFPLVSSHAELPRRQLRAKILAKRRLVLLGFLVLIAGSVCLGDIAIAVLYDARYTQARWMMSVLSLGVWFSVLFYTTSPCLLGIGKPIYGAQANLLRFITLAVGLPLGFQLGGTVGAIAAVAVSDLPSYLALQYGSWREKLMFWQQDLQLTACLLGIITVVIGIRVALGFGTPIDLLLAGSV